MSSQRIRAPSRRPLLLVDVDGVLSLFGPALDTRRGGRWLMVDGIPHFLSTAAGDHLRELAETYELAWCTGWEEKANEYLLHELGLCGPLACLRFDTVGPATAPHWKLAGIDAHAGPDRPLAWIDDAHDDACRAWAAARRGPTLLVATDPGHGLGPDQVARLTAWAVELDRRGPTGAGEFPGDATGGGTAASRRVDPCATPPGPARARGVHGLTPMRSPSSPATRSFLPEIFHAAPGFALDQEPCHNPAR